MNWVKVVPLLLLGCGHAPPPAPKSRFAYVQSFACQLQNLDPSRAPDVDLLIMDPTRDGNRPYTAGEVTGLKGGGRLLLAYLSVGEAENYRGYWQKSWKPGQPAWLGPANPDWGGNYKVRFWDPDWQALMRDYALQIQRQGFDGLFLDVVDGWEFWQKQNPRAKAAMAQLVLELAQATRRSQPDFGLVLNGGDGLLQEAGLTSEITGVAREEIFFGLGGDGQVTPPEVTRIAQNRLRGLVAAKKLVLSIDYTQDPRQKRLARQRARQSGYLEFIGTRGLDRIPEQ